MKRYATIAATMLACASMSAAAVPASAKENVRIAWSHYTGWEPWGYIEAHGIAQKAIENQCGAGSTIKIVLVNDYSESLTQFASGNFDGVAATNMDALTVPAVGGRNTDMLVVSDYSDGNDAVISGDPAIASMADMKKAAGHPIELEALTVSEYLLDRALSLKGAGAKETDFRLANTPDADMAGIYGATKDPVIVTWNPIVSTVLAANKGAKVLFTSKEIPGEIIDAMAVRTDLPACAKTAIRGAWFETIAKVAAGEGPVLDELAAQAGGSLEEFKSQLATTHLFKTPAEAQAFVASPALRVTSSFVSAFSYDHGMFGDGAKSADDVGVSFPDGGILGNTGNVKLHFVDQDKAIK